MNSASDTTQAPRPASALPRAERSMKYPLTPEQYISDRLDDQIRWYSNKSRTNQARFKFLQTTAILFSSAIPLIVGLWGNIYIGQVSVGVLSFLVAAIMGINSLYKFQENWIAYRTTAESLRHHKLLYLTQTAPYSGSKEAFHLLVNHVEALISKENSDWGKLMISTGNQGVPEPAAQVAAQG